MGGGGSQPSSTTVVQSSQSQSSPPTAQEVALQQLELERRSSIQPQLLQTDQNLFNLLGPLSRGERPGGIFSSLGTGISEQAQQEIIKRALTATNPTFEKYGLTDSGIKYDLQTRLAAQLATQSELARQSQIEALFSGVFGANVQANQPILNETNTLANSLASIRPWTSSSTSTTNQSTSGGRRGLFSFF